MKTAHKTLAAIFALLAIALFAACSSDSDDDSISASDLAGTTWTASYEGMTISITFETSGQVTMYGTSAGSYSASGSTVTIYDDDGDAFMQFTYSSGQLVYSEDGETITFTKVS